MFVKSYSHHTFLLLLSYLSCWPMMLNYVASSSLLLSQVDSGRNRSTYQETIGGEQEQIAINIFMRPQVRRDINLTVEEESYSNFNSRIQQQMNNISNHHQEDQKQENHQEEKEKIILRIIAKPRYKIKATTTTRADYDNENENEHNNNEPKKKHEAQTEEQAKLIRDADGLAATSPSYSMDRMNATTTLTLGRKRRSSSSSSSSSSSIDDELNTIHAFIGKRLIVPCINLTSLLQTTTLDQLTRSQAPFATTWPNQVVAGQSSSGHTSTLNKQQNSFSAGFQRSRQQASSSSSSGVSAAAAETISLIVWHKDDPQLSMPIFTIDARGSGGTLREARQQTGADWLRGRAHFEESTKLADQLQIQQPAHQQQQQQPPSQRQRTLIVQQSSNSKVSIGRTPALVIDEARQIDAGLYTCTVEFHKAPTQTYQIRVNLIDPPRDMVIREALDGISSIDGYRQINGSDQTSTGNLIAGPYDEDSRLSLTCEVEAGKPTSQISWWQLSSITSIPSASFSSSSSSIKVNHSNDQRHQTSSMMFTSSNTLANVDYLTTMSLMDNQEKVQIQGQQQQQQYQYQYQYQQNLFVGFHSRPFSRSNEDDSLLPLIVTSSAADHDAGYYYRFKHWTRVKDVNLSIGDDKIQATLQLSPLSRTYQGKEFLCLANNNQYALPLNKSVQIEMNLKPNEVRIMDKLGHSFKLGEKIMIECQIHGSKPRAHIRWFKDKLQLLGHDHNDDDDQNTFNTSSSSSGHSGSNSDKNSSYLISDINTSTTNNFTQISYLTMVPQLSDNMKSLSCVATNPSMQTQHINNNQLLLEPLSDSIIMNVQYPPQLRLQLGSGIKPEMIKVGSDVFMECNTESNPPIDDLTWYFNDQPVFANVSAGLIISNQSLVLQRIRVEHRGKYQCAAQNTIGRSISNKLELRPKFEPICDYSLTKTRYEVAINQQIRVACNILAEPNDDIHFVWKFNQTSSRMMSSTPQSGLNSSNSLVDIEMDHPSGEQHIQNWQLEDIKQYETNFTSSYAIFSPNNRRHYGQLLCYASNSMGRQSKPCIIQIVPPELPEPVFSCFFDGITNSSLSVYCQAPIESNNPAGGKSSYLLELSTSSSSSSSSSHESQSQFQSEPESTSSSSGSMNKLSSGANKTSHLKQQRQEQSTPEDSTDETTNFDEQQQSDSSSISSVGGGQVNLDSSPGGGSSTMSKGPSTDQDSTIRRVRSDTPSFHVSDLESGKQYMATIYVQNSKGRSRPIYYPVSTTSNGDYMASGNQQSGSSSVGRVQFMNKRLSSAAATASSSGEPTSLADRLISYLRVDDYLNRNGLNNFYTNTAGSPNQQGDKQSSSSSSWLSLRPMLAIVGLVLLSSCTIIVVAFFMTRLCRLTNGTCRGKETTTTTTTTTRSTNKRNRIWSTNNSLKRSLGQQTKLSTYGGLGKSEPKLERPIQQLQLQLTPTHSSSCSSSAAIGQNRLKALVCGGSGSDTSRETNTESTLISSTKSNSNSNNNNNNCQMIESHQANTRPVAETTTVSTVSGIGGGGGVKISNCMSAAAAAVRSSRESLCYVGRGGGAKSPIMMMMRPSQSAALLTTSISVSEQQQQQQLRKCSNLYSNINRHCSPNQQLSQPTTTTTVVPNTTTATTHSETPQMSIQSDCTSTGTHNTATTTDNLIQMQVNHSDNNHQELQIAKSIHLEHSGATATAAAGSNSFNGEPLYVIRSSVSSSNSSNLVAQQPSCNRNQNCLNSTNGSPLLLPSEQQQQQQSLRLVGPKGAISAATTIAAELQQQQQQQQQQNFAPTGWPFLGDLRAGADNRSGNSRQGNSITGILHRGNETSHQLDHLTATTTTNANLAYMRNGNANACNHHSMGDCESSSASGDIMLDDQQPPIPSSFLPSSSSIPVSLSECQHLHLSSTNETRDQQLAQHQQQQQQHHLHQRRRYSQEFIVPSDPMTAIRGGGQHIAPGSYLTLASAASLQNNYRQQHQDDQYYQQQQQQQPPPQFVNDLSQSFVTYVAEPEQHHLCCGGGGGAGRSSVQGISYDDQQQQQQQQQHQHHHPFHHCVASQTLDNSYRQSWRYSDNEAHPIGTPLSSHTVRRNSFDRGPTNRHNNIRPGQRVKFDDQ